MLSWMIWWRTCSSLSAGSGCANAPFANAAMQTRVTPVIRTLPAVRFLAEFGKTRKQTVVASQLIAPLRRNATSTRVGRQRPRFLIVHLLPME